MEMYSNNRDLSKTLQKKIGEWFRHEIMKMIFIIEREDMKNYSNSINIPCQFNYILRNLEDRKNIINIFKTIFIEEFYSTDNLKQCIKIDHSDNIYSNHTKFNVSFIKDNGNN